MDYYIQHVKNKLLESFAAVETLSSMYVSRAGKDFTRKRKLSFSTTVKMIFQMEGNTLGKELRKYCQYSLKMPSVSAFVQRRNLISPDAFMHIFHMFNLSMPDIKLYKGFRLLACDGSDLSFARNPSDKENYFQSNPGEKGFNLLHLNALYDLGNKRYVDAVIQPGRKESECRALCQMTDRLIGDIPTIIIADRAYESYNVFAHIEKRHSNYLIRVKDRSSNGILSALSLPESDSFDIDVHKCLTKKQTKFIKAQGDKFHFLPKNTHFDFLNLHDQPFYDMDFRVIRFEISEGNYECIITNLDRDNFPPDELKKLYHMRWGIETAFRDLKYTLCLSNFHSKKVECIKQEIFARLTLYNFCEIIANHIVIQSHTRKHPYQLNFSAAADICRQFLLDHSILSPPDVKELILRYLLPVRHGRNDPRKVKTRSCVSFIYRVS